QNLGALEGGGTERPYRMIVRRRMLVGDFLDVSNDVICHHRCRLRIDHPHGVVIDDDAGRLLDKNRYKLSQVRPKFSDARPRKIRAAPTKWISESQMLWPTYGAQFGRAFGLSFECLR